MEPGFMTVDYGVRPKAARAESDAGPNRLAVAGLVFGLLGLLPLPVVGPVLALCFGVAGGRKADRGEAGGRGMATAAIVLGIVGCVCAVLGLVVVFIQLTGSRGA
ncbi:DUF4190 domain-containing protein [Streptomyces sp. SID11385]|nr:DUF4190 domain-containing protein [Streptomyces sp. SID11385]